MLAMSGQPSLADDGLLLSYRWHNRLLLLFAPESDDPLLWAQNEILAGVEPGLRERGLVVFRLLPDGPGTLEARPVEGTDATIIYREFAIEPRDFTILLIGKDGDVKLSSDTVVAAERLFDLIDSMPVRQWEMQNQGSSTYQESL